MSISTLSAAFLITVVTVTLELLDRDYEKERNEFENSK